MDKQILEPWMTAGYKTFALEGPQGLKVERLSKSVGKNKSSFYHHFADLEVFTTHLLEYHLAQAEILAVKESECSSLDELMDVLVDHKLDLLFNRQLRVHRENPDFEKCFCQTTEMTVPAFLRFWMEILELTDNSYLAQMVLKLSLENFYLQITYETLTQEWLQKYFQDLRTMVKEFKKTKGVTAIDGSV